MTSYIEINNARLCNCHRGYLSCIEPRNWMKNQIGVWQFTYEPRDVRDKKVHPAVFPISMAKRVIEQFTHKGELVLDPFVGSRTTLVAAQELERNKEMVLMTCTVIKKRIAIKRDSPCNIASHARGLNLKIFIKEVSHVQ